MKTTTRSVRPRLRSLSLALAAAVLGLATLGAAHARAQASLTFSGGLGTPLTLTLNAPVTYAITAAGANGNAPLFDFQGVGNVFVNLTVSGTVTFTINGGAAQTFTKINSGFANGSVAAADAYIYGALPGVAVGNTVVLTAGTLTTSGNFAGAPPAGGSFPTFVFDGFGTKLDAVNGVSVVPEPSTWALLGVGVAGLGVVTLRRRAARA